MNLFWKKIFGRLQTTQKFEKTISNLMLNSSHGIAQTEIDEIFKNNPQKLQEYIESDEFKALKNSYINTKYRDTEEYKIWRKYEELLNDEAIKKYYQILKSELLKSYLNFKENPDSLALNGLTIVEISAKIESLKQFELSEEYSNYSKFHNSLIIREYEELQRVVFDQDFKEKNSFWANPNRWKFTKEYLTEQYYLELNGEAQESEKRGKNIFDLAENSLKNSFDEDFKWNILEESRWSAGFQSIVPQLAGNYSFTNERQANNFGKNISISNNILTLNTKLESKNSLSWNVQKGFVSQNFQYTADVIQTSETFSQKYGVFSAKIRCSKDIHHALWLKGVKKLPQINLFYFNGKNITLGNANLHKIDGEKIDGISCENFYIYTVVWSAKELVWYVNNVEVHRTNENIPHEKLFFGLQSFIPQSSNPHEGTLEVAWIKAFQFN